MPTSGAQEQRLKALTFYVQHLGPDHHVESSLIHIGDASQSTFYRLWNLQYITRRESILRQLVFAHFLTYVSSSLIIRVSYRTRAIRYRGERPLLVLKTLFSVVKPSSPAVLSSAATSDAQVLAMLSLSPLGGTVSLVKGLSSGKLKLHLSMGIHITTLSRQYAK